MSSGTVAVGVNGCGDGKEVFFIPSALPSPLPCLTSLSVSVPCLTRRDRDLPCLTCRDRDHAVSNLQ